MRGEDRQYDQLDVDQYLRSQSNLLRLKARMPPDRVESLAREVIRRLAKRSGATTDGPSDEKTEALCLALISEDDTAGATLIREACATGASLQDIYLEHLAAAARRLGEWWESDRVSFFDVTRGTSRMYAIMHAISDQFPARCSCDRCALFASVPGETHTLGVRMAADLFREDGWEIELKIGESHNRLVAQIERSKCGIVGLSAAGDHAMAALSKLVVAIRLGMPRRAVFVSGHIVEESEAQLELLDIDGTANDMDAAKALLDALWTQHRGRMQ
ncbi:MAG: cobalamin-dependent protein [Pseudomonadota bacterium]